MQTGTEGEPGEHGFRDTPMTHVFSTFKYIGFDHFVCVLIVSIVCWSDRSSKSAAVLIQVC
jgi:hypothetical protein